MPAGAWPTPPGCPTGTSADGARCRYPDGSLVPSLLGVELAGNVVGIDPRAQEAGDQPLVDAGLGECGHVAVR